MSVLNGGRSLARPVRARGGRPSAGSLHGTARAAVVSKRGRRLGLPGSDQHTDSLPGSAGGGGRSWRGRGSRRRWATDHHTISHQGSVHAVVAAGVAGSALGGRAALGTVSPGRDGGERAQPNTTLHRSGAPDLPGHSPRPVEGGGRRGGSGGRLRASGRRQPLLYGGALCGCRRPRL